MSFRDYESLDEAAVEENLRLAFDVAECEFGISPLMTVEEMLSVAEPDSLSMVMYLSQFYQLLSNTPPSGETTCDCSVYDCKTAGMSALTACFCMSVRTSVTVFRSARGSHYSSLPPE